MKARLASGVTPPRHLAYQSSDHCATVFATSPLTLTLPELLPSFVDLDATCSEPVRRSAQRRRRSAR